MLNLSLPKTYDIVSENGWSLETKIHFVETLLMSTNRKGIDKIIEFLRNTDFYSAPASTIFHSNMPQGLLNHSILTYTIAMQYKRAMIDVNPILEEQLPDESIALVAILHDICKCCFYVQKTKWRKDANDQWESYNGYDVKDTFPIGHGEKSVIMLQNLGLELTATEMLAIRYHMGMFGDGGPELRYSQNQAVKDYPLVPLTQMADFSASMIFEPIIK